MVVGTKPIAPHRAISLSSRPLVPLICIKAPHMASAWTTSMLGDPAPQPTYSLRSYRAWDAPTRWFHWINAVLVAALSILGIALLTGRKFGVGTEGRDLLERFHVMLGFALTINLLWRFYWAFHGNRYAQWRAILPMGPRYLRALQAYVASF